MKEWKVCSLPLGHDGPHAHILDQTGADLCERVFRINVYDKAIQYELQPGESLDSKGTYAPERHGVYVPPKVEPHYNPEPPFLTWAESAPFPKEQYGFSVSTGPGNPVYYGPDGKVQVPGTPVSGNTPPDLVPELDKDAPALEQARQAKKALDDLGVNADQALAMIMVEIATADSPRDSAQEWIAKFTSQVLEIVAENEGPDAT